MFTIRMFRDPLPPGIGDLGEPGDFPDLNEEEQKQKAAEAETAAQEAIKLEALNTDGSLKEGYEKDADGKIIKTAAPAADDPVEGLNADGTLMEGYKLGADGKTPEKIDPAAKPEDEELTAEQEAELFFTTVKDITGIDLPVEYPAGVEPLSPQGIAHRDQVLIKYGAERLEDIIREKDPRAYAYMVHRSNGGTDAEFMTENTGFNLPSVAEMDASAVMQEAVYRHDLKSRGLDDDSIKALVDKAIKDSVLKDKATAAHKGIDEAQKAQEKTIEKRAEEAKTRQTEDIKLMTDAVKESINSMALQVPQTEKTAFVDHVLKNLMTYDDSTGNFFIQQKVDPKSLPQMLDTLFFQFKKGNLKDLVQKQAKTEAAQNIRLKLTDKDKGKGGAKAPLKPNEHIPLGEL